jgi:hypothetical protein
MNDFLNISYTAVDYTVTDIDQYVCATVGGVTITLPTGILGRFYQIKNQSTGDTLVQGTGGELIDGTAFKRLKPTAGFMTVFDGTEWKIL